MEKQVASLVFRHMSYADFFNINKVGGEEQGGGGQSYIDFPTADISLQSWFEFLGANTGWGARDRPQWDFTINSLGIGSAVNIRIYQRREASVSIASQKLPENSRSGNRLPVWHPRNGFPNTYNEHLIVYLVKTTNGEFWAGWLLRNELQESGAGSTALGRMFIERDAGYRVFAEELFIDTNRVNWPFLPEASTIAHEMPAEDDIAAEMALEDTSPKLQELIEAGDKPEFVERIIKIRKRNKTLVKNLKELYGGNCQITGNQFTFKKPNGEWYSEVHHLIPLGEDGSDNYANTIVVSPLIHRMLHYATVSEINLDSIVSRQLQITINDKAYTITWAVDHASTSEDALQG
jgi:5-methylcytosine-specific restriction protein A